jgi:CDP-diacylglycerol--glycerol-3-phosphate 3-phosphatidyltransferase
MVALVLARELLVTSIRGAMEGMGVSFAASWSGKWKMILQSAVLPLVLVLLACVPVVRENPGTGRSWAGLVIDASVWLTVAVTAWSGAPYVSRALEAARSLSARREERGS